MNKRLTEEQVSEIRSLIGTMSQEKLGEKYGVTQAAISKIATGINRGWERYCKSRTNIIVINDPAKEGAFPKGAVFSHTELEIMLKDNCFTQGTKIEIKKDHGKLNAGNYTVKGKEMVKCE